VVSDFFLGNEKEDEPQKNIEADLKMIFFK